jgi:hypothetical protein
VTRTVGLPHDELRTDLERLLARRDGAPIHVRALEVSPSPFAGQGAADVVRIDIHGQAPTTVFLKHPPPDVAHPDKQRRDREQRVYRELLCLEGLPVADYLGSVPRGDGGETLVLRHVDDWDLRYQALDVWLVAAASLGSLHARFGDDPRLLASDALLRLDADYLRAWAQRAMDEVARHSMDHRRALERALAAFGVVVEPLRACVPTLVHNDLAPKNVLADRATAPATIRIIDWELAGVGCGMLDLVHICHGLSAEATSAMREVYVGAVAGTGLVPEASSDIARVETACRLHRTLYRLAHRHLLDADPSRVTDWVEDVVRLRAEL